MSNWKKAFPFCPGIVWTDSVNRHIFHKVEQNSVDDHTYNPNSQTDNLNSYTDNLNSQIYNLNSLATYLDVLTDGGSDIEIDNLGTQSILMWLCK